MRLKILFGGIGLPGYKERVLKNKRFWDRNAK